MNSQAIKKISTSILTDRFPVYILIGIILLYCICFGLLRFALLYKVELDWLSLTLLIPIFFTDSLKTLFECFSPIQLKKSKENIRKVTAIVPSYNGEASIGKTVENLLRRLPPGRIIVASNGSTDRTCEIARKLGVNVLELKKPIGKVLAINRALKYVKTEYTLILDDDTLVGNAVIPTSLIDQGYEGVAFRVMPVIQNWLSVLQSHEYRKSMDIGRGFHNATATVQTISGAIGLFYTTELIRQIRHHSGEFSGEDLQRTLLIHLSQTRKGVIITDSIVHTYVPATLSQLFNQRVFGWNPGFYANLGMYIQLLRKKELPWRLRYDAFYTIFLVFLLDPFRIVRLPVLFFSPTFILIFYVSYIFFDFIPYWRLGHKEPFWVVLVSPIYGLFNFLARYLSGVVFIFRRLSYYLGRVELYDEYKIVANYTKLFSLLVAVGMYVAGFSFYTYWFVMSDQNRKMIAENKYADIFTEVATSPASSRPTLLSIEVARNSFTPLSSEKK